jgi:putative transposase
VTRRALAVVDVSAIVSLTSASAQTLRWGGDSEGGRPLLRWTRTDFVLDALEQALCDRGPAPPASLIHHSDRGSQYLSMRYTERLADAGIAPSVGSGGDSYALAESVIGLYKTEVIQRRGPWRHAEAVEFATLARVDWFNHRRLLEPIGYVPPAEYEERYYAQAAVA